MAGGRDPWRGGDRPSQRDPQGGRAPGRSPGPDARPRRQPSGDRRQPPPRQAQPPSYDPPRGNGYQRPAGPAFDPAPAHRGNGRRPPAGQGYDQMPPGRDSSRRPPAGQGYDQMPPGRDSSRRSPAGQGPPPGYDQPRHARRQPPPGMQGQPGSDGRSVFIGPADQDPRRRRPPEPPGEHSVFGEPAADPAGYSGFEPPPPDLDEREAGKPTRSWKQRVLIGLGVFVVLMCLTGTLAAGWVLRTYNSIGRVGDLELNTVAAGEPKNYLIVGSDSRAGANGEYGSTGGQRSDSIMVLRIDPQVEQATVLSFPRDLQVEIPGLSGTRKINEAYAGESANPQRLIETLRENFGIPIHHYVEIDFAGFKNLIDHVGGIDLWFEQALRNPPGSDYDVGLWITEQGCVTVDGTQALALARSRVLEHREPDGWVQDPTSDYGRMTRQQIVIRQALKKAVSQAKSSPIQLKGLIELAADTVVLDELMSIDDMLDLADRFKDFDPANLLTYSLPTYTQDAAGKGNPYPEKPAAEPILNIFRGLPVNEVGPSLISLQVTNGSGKDGQAANVAGAFQKIGFEVQTPDSLDGGEIIPVTTVYHAPGQEGFGLRVARHVTGGAEVKASDALSSGEVQLVTGTNFTTVHEDPTPIDKLPTPTPPAPDSTATTVEATTTTTTAAAGGASPPTTAAPPPPTEQKGYAAGQPPPGKECG